MRHYDSREKTTSQSLLENGHDFNDTVAPTSMQWRCRSKKRTMRRLGSRKMTKYCERENTLVRTSDCPKAKLVEWTHNRLRMSNYDAELGLVPRLLNVWYGKYLGGNVGRMVVDRDYHSAANMSRIGQHYLFSDGNRLAYNVYHPLPDKRWLTTGEVVGCVSVLGRRINVRRL
jgi:hypothetical protein